MDATNIKSNEGGFPEYKGVYYKNDSGEEHCYEFGAHFPYKVLYDCLVQLKKQQENLILQSIGSIAFNKKAPLVSKEAFAQSNNKKESRNKKQVAPFKTVGIQRDKSTKSNNEQLNQMTSQVKDPQSITIVERMKKIKRGQEVKNMTFKHFIHPTNTIANVNTNINDINNKTRNTLQSIILMKDYTIQDISSTIKEKSRNKSRNKELDSLLLFSQCQGVILQHSSNEIGGGNGSNNTNNNNCNTIHTSKQNIYSKLITNKKSRNCYKGQLCLSNTHTTNENKSGGTNKTNKTVHTITNINIHKQIKTDSFGNPKIYKSLNDKENKKSVKKYTRPKVANVSNLKVTTENVITSNDKTPYNNTTNYNYQISNNNTSNNISHNKNSTYTFNDLNKNSFNQSDFLNGKNVIMRKYQREVTSKALKLLLLTNPNNQIIKKELSITKENKNISSSLSQEKTKKTKTNCSNTNTNSVLYNSSINDSKYSSQQPLLNNPNNSKNTNLNSYFTTNNSSNKNNNTSSSLNKTPIVAGQNQTNVSLSNQISTLLNKTNSKPANSKSIGRIHNYKACSFKYTNNY